MLKSNNVKVESIDADGKTVFSHLVVGDYDVHVGRGDEGLRFDVLPGVTLPDDGIFILIVPSK